MYVLYSPTNGILDETRCSIDVLFGAFMPLMRITGN
jgi:hypothetical protein